MVSPPVFRLLRWKGTRAVRRNSATIHCGMDTTSTNLRDELHCRYRAAVSLNQTACRLVGLPALRSSGGMRRCRAPGK